MATPPKPRKQWHPPILTQEQKRHLRTLAVDLSASHTTGTRHHRDRPILTASQKELLRAKAKKAVEEAKINPRE